MTDKIDDGGPAFPIPEQQFTDGVMIVSKQGADGMSIRDWFAGRAMQAFYSSFDARDAHTEETDLRADAEIFYRIVDAMLAERAKK
ncbi:MAG: hypothetical protein ACK5QX_09095 [bacterium]